MKVDLLGKDSWRWYYRMDSPGDRPMCISCEVYLIDIAEAFRVDVSDIDPKKLFHDLDPLICSGCLEAAGKKFKKLPDQCTLEELKRATNAAERIDAREEAFRRDKSGRAKEFRKERAKKAAKTRARKKAEDRS